MAVYGREDDLVIALQEATKVMQDKRFNLIACADNETEAAWRVTQVADVYVAWLRRIAYVTLTLVSIEELDTGEVASTPEEGVVTVTTNIDTSQRARWIIDATDDRNFPVDGTLAARSSDETVVTVVIEEATMPTASGKDELVATFAGATGTATVEVFDPATPEVVLAADVVVANPGAVAAATLGTAVVEEIPAPAPEPEPEPTPEP